MQKRKKARGHSAGSPIHKATKPGCGRIMMGSLPAAVLQGPGHLGILSHIQAECSRRQCCEGLTAHACHCYRMCEGCCAFHRVSIPDSSVRFPRFVKGETEAQRERTCLEPPATQPCGDGAGSGPQVFQSTPHPTFPYRGVAARLRPSMGNTHHWPACVFGSAWLSEPVCGVLMTLPGPHG